MVLGPSSLPVCLPHLRDGGVRLAVTAAYPSGAYSPESKAEEIRELAERYPEIDEFYVVMAVGLFLGGELDAVRRELAAVMEAAAGRTVKLVTELGTLSEAQMASLCDLAAEAGAPWIVTSTGFTAYDAPLPTPGQVAALCRAAAGRVRVVACGTVKTAAEADVYLAAGAERVCTACDIWM